MLDAFAALYSAHSATWPLNAMPPKVRTAALPPHAMASQPDSPAMPDEAKGLAKPKDSQKKKEKRPKGKMKASSKPRKGRQSQVTLVKHAIAKKVSRHPDEVQKFLTALDEVAVEFLQTKGVLRLHFVTVRLRTTPAREATQKLVCGKTVTLKARPARRSVKLTAAKCLKQLRT